ncbi:proliferating cell nuclear antigen [Babesia ovis]|uniref:Proliferating cell nuclear antigen n=1 Tax=Babesia ovis TaxID=5869 RepID=A0A9W5WVW6_BABOV|nr:proliferating cell nuclear antigen [Babesia ovis]
MVESEGSNSAHGTGLDKAAAAGSGSTKQALGRLGWRSRHREMQGMNRRRKVSKNDTEEQQRERVAYSEEVTHNEEFEQYYKDQHICQEDDWDEFMASARRCLPISFRVNACVPLWRRTIRDLENFGKIHSQLRITKALEHSQRFDKSEPDVNLYYQLAIDKSSLRKDEQIGAFRRWLIDEDNRGSLSRQETVSMLPVLYLDPQPHEDILDICAAPGMKFLQILDAVHTKLHYEHGQSPCSNRGVLVGNDVCQQRLSTLVHNVKGISCPSVAVTNFDASRFPNLYNARGEQLLFDRILADVPCSCDGTLRKAPDVWTMWKAVGGLHMHRLQLSIIKRVMQLLKPGGTLIYSTCSLNPLENEAIASYIASEGRRQYGVELVPLEPLPGFKVARGLTEWLVPNPEGGYYYSYESVPDGLRHRVTSSMFKAPEWDAKLAQYVIRVLPHYNDTGGFFLLKARKVSTGTGDGATEKPQHIEPLDVEITHAETKVSKRRGEKLLHDYVLYNEVEPDIFDNVCRFYGIEGKRRENFGRMLVTKRYSRNHCFLLGDVDSAALYQRYKGNKCVDINAGDVQKHQENLINDKEDVMDDTVGTTTVKTAHKRWERCRFAMVGIRAIVRHDCKATTGSKCSMRIAQEATLALLEFLGRRVVFANATFCVEMVKGNIRANTLLQQEELGNIHSLEPCRHNGTLESGGCIFIVVPAWGKHRMLPTDVRITLDSGVKSISLSRINTDDRTDSTVLPPQVTLDLMETIPISCVISDRGELFPYSSPYIMQMLRRIAQELE